jgi:hypothetical protein
MEGDNESSSVIRFKLNYIIFGRPKIRERGVKLYVRSVLISVVRVNMVK